MAMTLRLGGDLEARLATLAQATGRTQAYYIRAAIAEKIEEMEDLYLAQQRLEKPGRIWTMAEMERDFGLAD
jgi:RHH-type rel operon transcriptional repressor/antitoxin RelB